jgi:hypothetical protein
MHECRSAGGLRATGTCLVTRGLEERVDVQLREGLPVTQKQGTPHLTLQLRWRQSDLVRACMRACVRACICMCAKLDFAVALEAVGAGKCVCMCVCVCVCV